MSNHSMKPFVTRIAAESATVLHAVPPDFPALTHIDIACARRYSLGIGEFDRVPISHKLPPSVTSLDFEQASLEVVSALNRLPNLTALKLPVLESATAMNSLGDTLAQLSRLRELSVHLAKLRDLAFLNNLTQLRSLKLKTGNVHDWALL